MNSIFKRVVNPARYATNYKGSVNGVANAPRYFREGVLGERALRLAKEKPVKLFVPKKETLKVS